MSDAEHMLEEAEYDIVDVDVRACVEAVPKTAFPLPPIPKDSLQLRPTEKTTPRRGHFCMPIRGRFWMPIDTTGRRPEPMPCSLSNAASKTGAGPTSSMGKLADRMKTFQAYIAQLEGDKEKPSTRTLDRFAQAKGPRFVINFEPLSAGLRRL